MWKITKKWGPGHLTGGGRKRAKNGPKYGVCEKCQKWWFFTQKCENLRKINKKL